MCARNISEESFATEQAEFNAYNQYLVTQHSSIYECIVDKLNAGDTIVHYPSLNGSYDSKVLAHYARRFKSAIQPMEASPGKMVRIGSEYDGGYVMLEPGKNGIAYSLGIAANVDWDLGMAERGFEIFQYDGSIAGLPYEHPKFNFYPYWISKVDNHAMKQRELASLLRENGHEHEKNIILKIDIEGAEWDVFEVLPRSVLMQFKQIVIELHVNAYAVSFLPIYVKLLERIKRTHQPIHVHANNYGPQVKFSDENFCYFYEVCYARRNDFSFSPSSSYYPTPLDAPCNPKLVELELGQFGLFL